MTIENSADNLLPAIYDQLDFSSGALYDSTTAESMAAADWTDKGDWLVLAQKVGVEKIFFVENDPVIVFTSHHNSDEAEVRKLYNRIWCMARPMRLFLATPGELKVFDLTREPVQPNGSTEGQGRLLQTLSSLSDVSEQLSDYHRSRIEAGLLPAEAAFGDSQRADQSLIRDITIVRDSLVKAGLKSDYAHALIGRSIFVRYLEDREILLSTYFSDIANADEAWKILLNRPYNKPGIDPDMEGLLFPKVLFSKDFTYALFDRLAEDFNGDMFPSDPDEKEAVQQAHLDLLRGFLLGDTSKQQQLFFYAYRFDIIPIELISSMYEQFYNTKVGKGANRGSHYTRSTLVEFLLSQVLTHAVLSNTPRVLDPACGSGIFLVEAFRRIVRYLTVQRGHHLSRLELLDVLRNQIAGIELNENAVRISAFSLYLALLHYQDPRDIRQQPRLPHLIYRVRDEIGQTEYYDILITANAFAVESKIFDIGEFDIKARFLSSCADVVVGNPPWGYPKNSDRLGVFEAKVAEKWCADRNLTLGDKELSQAFIHRTMDLLRQDGVAAMLVSSGVFFKSRKLNQDFRKQWLTFASLTQVVNFSHVREIFFQSGSRDANAIAPFASVIFTKRPPENRGVVSYWSAKKTAIAALTGAVYLSRNDLRIVPQIDLLDNEDLWKIYWWGSHRDEAFISLLRIEQPLRAIRNASGAKLVTNQGYGFVKGKAGQKDAEKLAHLPLCPTDEFRSRFGPLEPTIFQKAPSTVYRFGKAEVYEGLRLLVKGGITQKDDADGEIVCRLESQPFCFTHSIYGLRLSDASEDDAKIVLAILWSSLARYYFFMTSSQWGNWHDSIYGNEILRMPIHLGSDYIRRNEILDLVNRLRVIRGDLGGIFTNNHEQALFKELDELVFDMYDLSVSERDLVLDTCQIGLPLYYRGENSISVESVHGLNNLPNWGNSSSVEAVSSVRGDIRVYIETFLSIWEPKLGAGGRFRWRIIRPSFRNPLIGLLFESEDIADPLPNPDTSEDAAFQECLSKMASNIAYPFGSKKIFVDGLVRLTTESEIILIKRNERRLWTASAAREDAEATILQAMNLRNG